MGGRGFGVCLPLLGGGTGEDWGPPNRDDEGSLHGAGEGSGKLQAHLDELKVRTSEDLGPVEGGLLIRTRSPSPKVSQMQRRRGTQGRVAFYSA